MAALAIATLTGSAHAEDCEALLAEARRLVLVTTSSYDSRFAKLRRFTRVARNQPWVQEGKVEAAVVGQMGLAWGAGSGQYSRDGESRKIEGDKRTPAGIFRIGRSFGFSQSKLPGHVVLKAGDICVDDTSSAHYGKIGAREDFGANTKGEEMLGTPLYRNGLFIEYPIDRSNKRGSCIFVHVWRASTAGTAGCVALPEAQLRALQEFALPGAVLAVLPEPVLDRFRGCIPTVASQESN